MRAREVVRGKAARRKQRDRKRIAHGQRGGGAGRGSQIVGAGFLCHSNIDVRFGRARQRGFGIAGQGDQRYRQSFQVPEHGQYLGRLTGIRQGHQHVAARDHAEVTVTGFRRVQEKGGRASAGQRGGDLMANMTGFAHAGHDQAPAARQTDSAGMGEGGIELCAQCVEGRGLNPERAASGGEQAGVAGLGLVGLIHKAILSGRIIAPREPRGMRGGCGPCRCPANGLRSTPMTPQQITELLRGSIPEARIEVRSEDNTHFTALLVGKAFEGLRPLARHQLVYRALGERVGREIHALSIEAYTPAEWEREGG